MRRLLPLLGALVVAQPALAQMPAPSHEAVAAPLQPGAIDLPGATTAANHEVWFLDAGRLSVRNVDHPTLLPVLPVGPTTGTAVIVAPGGGFLGLAIDHEGWQIARWLANHGVAAFVLKYRVLPTPPAQAEFADKLTRAVRGENVGMAPPDDTPPEALADGLTALRWLRAHAADYGIDPARIGFMGFSAGGFLTRSVIGQAGADMPAFAAPIYPDMAPMAVPANAPPMFVAIAADDFLLARAGGPKLVESYRAAGKSIEFHMFAAGNHGFGPGNPGTPTEGWLNLLLRWINTLPITKGHP